MAAKNIRLWQRDLDIIREAGRSPLLTSQIQRLQGFPSRKKAAERLHLLYEAGFLNREPAFFPGHQGKAEFWYFTGTRRPNQRTHAHTKPVGQIRVQIAEWLPATAYDFFYAHEVQTSSGLIADATLLLRKAEKTGLFFFEFDNGTEAVTSPSGYSLAKKLSGYANYFDRSGYVRDFAWAGILRGFRVALIVPAGRLRHVQHLVAQEQHDFVLLSTLDLLREGLHRPIWVTHDGTRVDLLGRPGELLGDVLGEMVGPSIPTTGGTNP